MVYVPGIVVDRLAHGLFKALEMHSSGRAGLQKPEETERYVVASSKALGRQIQCNRSRLRICRPWTLNALLVSLAFVVWNARVEAVPFLPSLVLVGVGVAACILMAWGTWALMQDQTSGVRISSSRRAVQDRG